MEENITEVITNLAFQLAVIIFAVRIFGKLAAKVGIPSVLGELIAGIIIGPFALGGIAFPGFPHGLFPVFSESLAVHPTLYAFGQVASIILLFASGLETDLGLFIKYSVSGGIIGVGGVLISFAFGDVSGYYIINFLAEKFPGMVAPCNSFFEPVCLFLGIMSTATSVGITARILSDKKKMDSPEGVTILAAAVFDDVLGIVLLAVVMGIVTASKGGSMPSGGEIGLIAAKAVGIWLFATVLFILLAKKIAKFVRLFGGSFDFSVAAFGVALVLAGIFEKQGLAMIIGAYTTGLALSKTDIAPVIQEKIHGLYKFFVPVFFAVTGMSVDVTQLCDVYVIVCGLIFTVICVIAKIVGCGGPALGLGFNLKGAFRIGAGMIPRGEVALIVAGIGLGAGLVDQKMFGIVIMMTLLTTLVAPPILNLSLGLKGRGTKKESSTSESLQFIWDFKDAEINRLVVDIFLRDLRSEGFYVQMMNLTEGISQARKGDIAISIHQKGSVLQIEAAQADMGFVKGEICEVVLRLNKSLSTLGSLRNTDTLQFGFASPENRISKVMYKVLDEKCISCELKADTKEGIFKEMIDLLDKSGCVVNKDRVLADVIARDTAMSVGLEKGIAIPHARTDGVNEICVAIGIKKDGVDFNALDKKPSNIFVMIVSPASSSGPQMRVMSAISGALMKEEVRTKLLDAKTPAEVMELLKEARKIASETK